MAYKIREVNIDEYYSKEISEKMLMVFLLEGRCSTRGSMKLTLKPNRDLRQSGGPKLVSGTLWVASFGKKDEFVVYCSVW